MTWLTVWRYALVIFGAAVGLAAAIRPLRAPWTDREKRAHWAIAIGALLMMIGNGRAISLHRPLTGWTPGATLYLILAATVVIGPPSRDRKPEDDSND